jgi:hypothetical protein
MNNYLHLLQNKQLYYCNSFVSLQAFLREKANSYELKITNYGMRVSTEY